MSGFFMFKRKIFLNSRKRLIVRGYKILLDLLYIKNHKIRVFDVKINFDSRMKGRSKMNFKILINLISMITQKFLRKFNSNWWACLDSNQGPRHYEWCALTN